MNGKRHTPEQIIQRQRRAEIEISKRAPGRQGYLIPSARTRMLLPTPGV